MISLRPRRAASGHTRLSFFGLTVTATLTALLVSLTVTGGASAYYTEPGLGSGSAALGTLLPPTDVIVPLTSAGTVGLSWTASAGTPAPSGYFATRTETGTGSSSLACSTSPTSTVAALSCDDTVPSGDYTYTVTAVYKGWTAVSAPSGSVTVSNPAKLAFRTQPSSSASGTIFTTQPSVLIQNSAGATVTTSTSPVTLSITGSPAGATLTCTQNPLPAASGIATFSGCQIDQSGTYRLTATSAGLTAATSDSFTISAGTARKLAFTTQPGDSTGGAAFPTQPVVTVLDAFGNPVTTSNAPVTLSITTPAGATLTCTTNPLAAASGIAKFSGCAIDRTGTYHLTASSALLTSVTSTSLTISVGSAAKLSFKQPGVNFSATSQATFAAVNQPWVTVQDAGGNTVSDSTASVSLSLTPSAGAVLSCTTNPLAAASGIAAFSECKIDKAGTYTLTATSAGLTAATSSSIIITAGPATRIAFTAQPTNSTGGVAFPTQPVISVLDAFGNTVTTNTAPVTLGIKTPAGSTLTCTTNPLAAASGVAAFTGCKINTPGTYALTAVSGSWTAESAGLTITVGPEAKLAIAFPTSTATSKVAFSTQPVVTAQDSGGNTVTNSTMTVTLSLTNSPVGATLSSCASTRSSGVTTFTGCQIDKAGSYTLTASINGPITTTSNTIKIAAGDAAKLTFTGSFPGSTFKRNAMFSPIVTVQDASGNTVDIAVIVTLSLTATPGGALSCPAQSNPTTSVGGVATFSSCSISANGNQAGSYTFKAVASGLPDASTSVTITP